MDDVGFDLANLADMLIEKWQANVCFSSVCQPFFGRKT